MNKPPIVIVISSQVASGYIGARANAFCLEQLGLEVVLVPTISLPFQPGHGPAPRIVPPAADFAAHLDRLANHISRPAALLSGYLGEASQANAIAAFVDQVKPKHYLCDPVIGDHGDLYVDAATAHAVRDQLLPRATMATPNCFELSWLTSTVCESAGDIIAAARRLGPKVVAATSVPAMLRGHIGTALIEPAEAMLAESRFVAGAPHGVGDTFAGLFLGHCLNGQDLATALTRAVGGVSEAIAISARCDLDDLPLVPARPFLVKPRQPVPIRKIG